MNDEPEFLRIRNWERFQEYKDGRPMRFFRIYTSILDDPIFAELADVAVVFRMMALAARTGNKIQNNEKYLQRALLTSREVNVKKMLEAGFLEVFVEKLDDASIVLKNGSNGFVEPSVELSTEIHQKRIEEKRREEEQRLVVKVIYDHWRSSRSKLHGRYDRISDNRRKKIVSRLREFSADELIRAIDAVALDPWEERPRHDDLVVLFRNEEQVQKFLALAEDDSVLNAEERQRRHLDRLRSEGKLT